LNALSNGLAETDAGPCTIVFVDELDAGSF
jgi:hypothetical protein